MPNVQPIQQPCLEDLKNALTIADFWQMGMEGVPLIDTQRAFRDIARLIRHALSQLEEPNAAAIHDATVMLRAAIGPTAFDLAEPRLPRDVASVILHAQLTGLSPETW